jgi:hypothetical protein
MPKPQVALCRAKPMMSTVARLISPAFAETPMARPSAKLWIPIATRHAQAGGERPSPQGIACAAELLGLLWARSRTPRRRRRSGEVARAAGA